MCVFASAWLFLPVLIGCGGTGSDENTPFNPVSPEQLADPRFGVFPTERVDAVLGLPLVILVELAGGFLAEDIGDVVLDDGRKLETSVVWLGVKLGDASGSWLEPAGEWSARTTEEVARGLVPVGEFGIWAVMLDPPIDAVGQGLWIAGQRHAVNWLPDPSVVASRVSSRAWLSPVPPEMRESQRLRFLVESERNNPFRRWRYRLMVGDLSPVIEDRIVELDGSVRRSGSGVEWASGKHRSDVLELLSRQRESRWVIGLARLDQADSELAVLVRRRLCAVVDFGAGEIAPLWPTQGEGVNRLLTDLLDQRLLPRERARRARLWLDDQARSVAWIVSDAPRTETVTGLTISTVAAANPDYQQQFTSIDVLASGAKPELTTLEPLTARAFEVASASAVGEVPTVLVSVGDQERTMAISGTDLKARPPGLRIERFFGDWSMQSLQASSAPAIPGGRDWQSGSILYREPAGRWVLFIQCASPEQKQQTERLRVTLGPEGAPGDAVLEFSPGSEPTAEFSSGPMSPMVDFTPDVEIDTFPGGWSARLVIPERSIEAAGELLRLGIERVDSQGRRSAWPRPMLPWQGACGRAAVDLTTWGSLNR